MLKINNKKSFILISLLITGLVVFSFSVVSVLAEGEGEGENGDGIQIETPEPYCGDSNLDEGEQCDDGVNNGLECTPEYGSSYNYCSTDCQTVELTGPYCGDGNLDDGEECDDGNNEDSDGCSANCIVEEEVSEPVCGDGIIEGDEECEYDEDCNEGMVCNNCICEEETQVEGTQDPYCGDGGLDEGEECDDGNNENGDGCSSDCIIEDSGVIEEGEEPQCTDNDGDGYYVYDEVSCLEGNDCDDSNFDINPGVIEICDNQIDDDCDGETDCTDTDCGEDLACSQSQPEGNTSEEDEEDLINDEGEANDCGEGIDCEDLEEIIEEIEESECEDDDCVINIVSDNEAVVENNILDVGSTGGNQVESDSGDATISTGDTNLVVGLFNTVNTNLTNFDFSQFLFNIFENSEEDIDLSEEFGVSSQENCEPPMDCFNIVNNNQGSIENNILVDASTGDNSAGSNSGDAIIQTGDANVITNVFNFLNSNIIGTNWTQIIINVFDDWVGDLLFPGKEVMQEFMGQESSGCGGGCGGTNIVSSNEGEIENEVYAIARTGGNTANGAPGIINTGDANVQTNLFNIANSNLAGGSWFFMGINVFSEWKGNIFSLPPGLGMNNNSNGIEIYNLGPEDLNNPTNNSSLNIVNNNSGSIKNSVIVNVSTGDNTANSNGGLAGISTGNANVLTNLVNVLNSNISGNNWLLGMINVFGSWQGNLAFGRPDLWIGMSAVPSRNAPQPGDSITYTLTYINNGDADATGVTIIDDYDQEHFNINGPGSGKVSDNPGEIIWNIGTVPAGSSGSVSYTGAVNGNMPFGEGTYLTNIGTIDSFEEDWNYENNTDTISIEAVRPYPTSPCGMWPCPSSPPRPNLEITKTNNVDEFVYTGSEVDYQIFLYNNSRGPAYEVVVEDILINKETSEVFSTQSWDLGQVFPFEEITIDYTVAIGSEVSAGFYKNTAKATGRDSRGNPVWTSEVSNIIEVKAKEAPPAEEGEGVEEELEEEAGEEITLEEIERRLKEIGDTIEIISEEVNRVVPPLPALPPTPSEPSPESLVSEISEILIPETFAHDEQPSATSTPPPTEKRGLERFLAAIGGIFANLNLKNILIGSLLLLLIIFLLFFFLRQKRKENKR